ncbi:IS66 family insertion sequence element accessory protein TnpA [Caballeronia grimmiae]
MSGVGTRRLCREQGLAVSTFGLWRKKFSGETLERGSRILVSTSFRKC